MRIKLFTVNNINYAQNNTAFQKIIDDWLTKYKDSIEVIDFKITQTPLGDELGSVFMSVAVEYREFQSPWEKFM